MKESVTTTRPVTVVATAAATLPPGVKVDSWKTTDAGEIAKVLIEAVVRDALADAGFVFGPDGGVVTIVAHKGPAAPASGGMHNDRQAEARKEAAAYEQAKADAMKLLEHLRRLAERDYGYGTADNAVKEWVRRRLDEGWRFIPPVPEVSSASLRAAASKALGR